MRITILFLLLPFIYAAKKKDIPDYNAGKGAAVVESFNKDYFTYFKMDRVYNNRSSYNTVIDVHLLKPLILDNLWLDVSFYHRRGNQYHMMPIGRGVPVKKFIDDDTFGIGSSLKKYLEFPVQPKKYKILVPNENQSKNGFDVPMFGEFKMCVITKDSNVPMMTICWAGTIEKPVKGKPKKL